VYNPQACAQALEDAIVRAVPWILRILPAVEEGAATAALGSEAIMLTPVIIPGDSGPVWRVDPYKPAEDVLPGRSQARISW
jgi:hypothetical protein